MANRDYDSDGECFSDMEDAVPYDDIYCPCYLYDERYYIPGRLAIFHCVRCDLNMCFNCFKKHNSNLLINGEILYHQINDMAGMDTSAQLKSYIIDDDIEFNSRCTVCWRHNTSKRLAFHFCPHCFESLCQTCYVWHNKLPFGSCNRTFQTPGLTLRQIVQKNQYKKAFEQNSEYSSLTSSTSVLALDWNNKALMTRSSFSSESPDSEKSIGYLDQSKASSVPDLEPDFQNICSVCKQSNRKAVYDCDKCGEKLCSSCLVTHLHMPENTERKSTTETATNNANIKIDAEKMDIHEIEETKPLIASEVNQLLELFDIDNLCMKHGRKSTIVKYMCGWICDTLNECSMNIVRVWPAYKHGEENKIVFVVITNDNIEGNLKIPPQFETLNILVRALGSTNDEESEMKRCNNCNEKIFTEAEIDELESILKKETGKLMDAHSNLNIISASPLKSTNYRTQFVEPLKTTSIVFYVHLKGYIPIKEDAFPTQLGSFTTDVREAVFELYSPKNYHENLKMGCLIGSDLDSDRTSTSGTLGAFIDLPGGRVGCITSAHAILNPNQMADLIIDKNKTYDNTDNLKVYQPPPRPNVEHFGYVKQAVYKEGDENNSGVEAALIEITDTARYPNSADFPEVHCEHGGLTSTERYTSGRFYKKIPKHSHQLTVIKYGSSTSLTRGAFKLNAVTANTRTSTFTTQEHGFDMCLRNQIEMTSVGTPDNLFADRGDSGSLVLIAHGGKVSNLQAIGIITGGNNHGTFYMTPIWEILLALGLGHLNRLKTFPKIAPQNSVSDEMDIENNETTGRSLFHNNLEEDNDIQNVSADEFNKFKGVTNELFNKIDKTFEDRHCELEQKIQIGHQKLEERHHKLEQKIERGQQTLENKIRDTFEDGQRRIESKIEDGRGKTIDDISNIILNDRKNNTHGAWQCAIF